MDGLTKGSLAVLFAVLIIVQIEGLTVVPKYDIYYVKSGGILELNCSTVGTDIQWYFKGNPITENVRMTSVMKSGQTNTDLDFAKSPATADDSGTYKCETQQNSFSIVVKVVSVKTTDVEFRRNMGTVSFECEVTDPANIPYKVHWERDNQPLQELSDFEEKYTVFPANNTLVINNVERADAGEYRCVLEFDSNVNGTKKPQYIRATYNLRAAPLVKQFEKSKNLIKGDNLELKCGVYGHPLGNVTWKKDDQVLDGKNGSIIFEAYGAVPNAILRIQEVDFDDRGKYMCLVTNNLFNSSSNSTILVRVKDKLAALWPFLGIVAEVIILCLIILIYEKKRSKEDPADADEADMKSGSVNANEANEVRQRNVRA